MLRHTAFPMTDVRQLAAAGNMVSLATGSKIAAMVIGSSASAKGTSQTSAGGFWSTWRDETGNHRTTIYSADASER